MGYIYCITNLVNGKQYVGKTTYSVTKRFKEHCKDSSKRRNEKRPLYDAMNKYGIENFVVEQLCECDNEELSSYEIQYIEKLNTYHTGYNVTKGGDGKILFDYNEIISLYKTGISMVEVAAKIGCSVDTVSRVVHINKLPNNRVFRGFCREPIKVQQLTLDGKLVKTWDSISDAASWLVSNGYAKTLNGGVRQKISRCAKGKLKTAYKFIWKMDSHSLN